MKKFLLFTVLIIIFYSCGEDFKKETCNTSSNCSTGKACYDGLCFDDYCKSNSIDCGQGSCVAGSLSNYDDYFGDYAKDYYCKCNIGSELIQDGFDYKCKTSGEIGDCLTNTDCNSGFYCNYFKKCEKEDDTKECYNDSDCQTNYECDVFNKCKEKTTTSECNYDSDCQTNYECKYNKCVEKTTTDECTYDYDCPSNQACNIYKKCEDRTTTNDCDVNSDCPSGYYCFVQSCNLKECNTDSDCPEGKSCNQVLFHCFLN